MIVESMNRNLSSCIYRGPGHYNATELQTTTFQLDSSPAHITQLFVLSVI